MDNLLFSINIILPIIIPILIGYIFRKTNFLSEDFFKKAIDIVFKFFLPVLLFKNLYNADLSKLNLGFGLFVLCGLTCLFLMGFIPTLFIKDPKQKGVFHASVFRTNYAFIGIPLALMLAPEDGEIVATVIAAVCLPLLNILGTIVLTIYDKDEENKASVKKVLYNIVTNPVIIAVVLGVITSIIIFTLRENGVEVIIDENTQFLPKTIDMISGAATPLSLIALGGSFKFTAVSKLWKQVTMATIFRLVVAPLIMIPIGYYLGFSDASYMATMIALFGAPISVISATMASQFKQDYEYAVQILVWNTVFSSISLFFIIWFCKSVGIF